MEMHLPWFKGFMWENYEQMIIGETKDKMGRWSEESFHSLVHDKEEVEKEIVMKIKGNMAKNARK
jgi:hypothetical protein